LNHDVGFIKYAPLSYDYFLEVWTDEDPEAWVAVLENKVYFPPNLLSDDYVDTITGFFLDSLSNTEEDLYASFRYSFIELLFRHSKTPNNMILENLEEQKFLIANPEAPADLLSLYFTVAYNSINVFMSAVHPNTSIDLAASYLLDNMEALKAQSSYKEYAQVEKNCNLYLANLGWDYATLDATPLSLKLETISN